MSEPGNARERLAALRRTGLHRQMRTVEGSQGPRVRIDGAEVLLLCSNNYLGLADHPRVRQAAADAAQRLGAGSGASRLISGTMEIHRELEGRLAEFKEYEAALLFGAGYLANTGVVAALTGRAGSSSRTSSTMRRSSTAAGSPGPRSSSTATATPSTSSTGSIRRVSGRS